MEIVQLSEQFRELRPTTADGPTREVDSVYGIAYRTVAIATATLKLWSEQWDPPQFPAISGARVFRD